MVASIALIAEGVTDQAVLENLLLGCFHDPEIEPLQPLRDATNAGHDLLELARSESAWRNAEQVLMRTTGAVTFQLLHHQLMDYASFRLNE